MHCCCTKCIVALILSADLEELLLLERVRLADVSDARQMHLGTLPTHGLVELPLHDTPPRQALLQLHGRLACLCTHSPTALRHPVVTCDPGSC